MGTKNLNPNKVIPQDTVTEAQNISSNDKIHKIALRRSKVRELMRMGYTPPQMVRILEKGIKIKNNVKIHVPVSLETIHKDIDYLRQEGISEDVDFLEKRADIKDKLEFLYNRAVTEYLSAKGSTRATFINTALSILSKIMELEGVKSPENLNVNLGAEAKIAKFSTEIHKLSENDKHTIIAAIRKVVEQRRSEGVGNTGVPSQLPGVPAQTGNNGRVPRKS